MKRGFLGLWLALLPLAAIPADSLPGRYFRFERLVPESAGKPVVGISSILQDRDGYLWFGTGAGLARYDGYEFVFYSPSAGRSQASFPLVVYPIIQDRAGDIWVGTHGEGLLRFDRARRTFVQYRHDPRQPDSLAGDIVLAIQEDSKGDLWVGTRLNGLARFDREAESFARIRLDPEVESVWDLLLDRRGSLWAATLDGGLFRIDPDSGETVNYRFILDNPRSLGSNTAWALFEDRAGTLWVGTSGGGLNRYVPEDDGFQRFYGDEARPGDLAASTISAIAEDESGRLWVGTTWNGLRIWDRATGRTTTWRHDPQDPETIGGDSITSILKDASGVMWVGTSRGGIGKCLADEVKFRHFKPNLWDPDSLGGTDVRALCLDRTERLWVGLAEGFDRIVGRDGSVVHVTNQAIAAGGPGPGAFQAVVEDRRGRVWLGTERGLYVFDPESEGFVRYLNDPSRPNSLSHNRVHALSVDRDDPAVLWVGTQNGLNRFDTSRGRWRRFFQDPADPHSLSGDIVKAVGEDREGGLWVGTTNGLNRLDKATGRCLRYVHHITDPPGSGLASNAVNCVLEDRLGSLWIGTDAGLSRFDRQAGAWSSFNREDGLPGSSVAGILEDESGFLWVGTDRGLSKFDPGSGTFTNFGLRDGLQSLAFNPGACFRAPDGRMFFGGVNGFNAFSPAAVRPNSFVPPVVWTGLARHGRPVGLGSPYVHKTGLEISYKFGFMTLNFAALCYIDPAGNRFAYQLDPPSDDWIDLGSDHSVSIPGFQRGSHVLRVKAANPDGVWNDEPLEISIRIIPPFWKTGWFLGGAVLFLLAGTAILAGKWKRLKASSSLAAENLGAAVVRYGLTAREEEILRLVLEGARNKDIEARLFISASTVRNHIYNIYQKLGVKTRIELVNLIGRKQD